MAIVRHLKSNCLYRYLGDNKFKNIVTGKEGVVDSETARTIFKINLDATGICGEYPLVEELIQRLNLKVCDVVGDKV